MTTDASQHSTQGGDALSRVGNFLIGFAGTEERGVAASGTERYGPNRCLNLRVHYVDASGQRRELTVLPVSHQGQLLLEVQMTGEGAGGSGASSTGA